MAVNTTVWTRVELPGFHRWPNAHPPREYLRDRHRHLFHIEVEVPVRHDERDVEFHDLQDLIRSWWGPRREWGAASCESIAKALFAHLRDEHGIRPTRITISEDGESGANLVVAEGD